MTVLDTHVWVWWVAEPHKLSRKARREIDEATRIGVCAISIWEAAMLVEKGRLRFDRDILVWIRQALALPRVTLIPLSPEIAVRASQLGHDAPTDPADRIIIATALEQKAKVVTKDRRIGSFKQVGSVW